MQLDVLAIAAHPDDVELTCGGTLIKMAQIGYRTGILDLTDGEMGTRGSAEIRQQEAAAAARVIVYEAAGDDALRDLAASRQQQDMVESLVSATRKQARFLPSGHVLKEILCIAWVIADETFRGGREEGSTMT